jgi:hypothetical protein
MAKPTTNAVPICLGLTIVAAIGAIITILYAKPIVMVLFLLPTVIYELYRTQEGASTKWASWGMLIILILELILILTGRSYDIGQWLGASDTYVGGFTIPLGDIKVLAPAILAVLSLILAFRTAGIYTKWLAGIILVGSFVLIFTISPGEFKDFLRTGIQQLLWRI